MQHAALWNLCKVALDGDTVVLDYVELWRQSLWQSSFCY